MTLPFCDNPYCRQPNPKLYDERTELYFCDKECLTEYFVENPEGFIGWYSEMNVHDVD